MKEEKSKLFLLKMKGFNLLKCCLFRFGHVFNADTGTSTGEIMGTSKPINSVDFKPTRPFRAVVASEDNSVCYFEGPPFKWKRSLNVILLKRISFLRRVLIRFNLKGT